ncbi:MAG: ABC transporter ATP-binding protein [Clostridiales bacterium]|nr:ABC transporter ATP-binding protein [Clostridiales bacterium]
MAILTAEQVEYTYQTKYQTVYALRGVDCAFETGQMTAIVGASGSGKTTLLSLLAGLDVPTAGSINFQGQSTAEMDRDAWRLENVSVIYQNFNLFAHLTALENAAYPLYLQKRPKKQAEEEAAAQLAAVGIRPDQFGRYPRMLSGGEQQRVAIARALAAGSGLILADEPTGNLDEENSRNIFTILRDLAHERERCVVVVTHDMELAQQTDRIVRIQDGRIAGET